MTIELWDSTVGENGEYPWGWSPQLADRTLWSYDAANDRIAGADKNTSSRQAIYFGTRQYTDVDVVAKIRLSTITVSTGSNALLTGALARASGNATTTTACYIFGPKGPVSGTTVADVGLYKYASGSITEIATSAKTLATDTDYFVRLRCIGTAIKGKLWAASGSEPGAWDIEEIDGDVASGNIGLFSIYGNSGDTLLTYCYWFTASDDPENIPAPLVLNTASVTLTLNDPASGGSAWASKTGLAVGISVDRDSAPFYSATGQSTNGSGELAIAATGCPLAAGTQTVWIRITDSDGLAGGVGNDSNAFYAPVSVTVA